MWSLPTLSPCFLLEAIPPRAPLPALPLGAGGKAEGEGCVATWSFPALLAIPKPPTWSWKLQGGMSLGWLKTHGRGLCVGGCNFNFTK